jgi:hypothetical protein
MKQVEAKKSAPSFEPVSDADLREIERSTVLLAEVTAGCRHTTTEKVLSMAFDTAAVTGSSPFEVLRRMRSARSESR